MLSGTQALAGCCRAGAKVPARRIGLRVRALPGCCSLLHTSATPSAGLQSSSRSAFGGLALSQPARARRRQTCRLGVTRASFLGVGAPEAFVIGVVALLVFGPKGLAELAKQAGSTLRAFQPTIKELQSVSQDFKNALDAEIGLDDPAAARRRAPLEPTALDEQLTEEMRRSAEAAAWGGSPPGATAAVQPPQDAAATTVQAQAPPPAPAPGKLPDLSKLDG